MTDFHEFRVAITPNLQMPGLWDVELRECSIAGLIGPMGSVQPAVTQMELLQLRSRINWPNLGSLHTIGESVWQSLMTPNLNAAYLNCLQAATAAKRGLRLVVTLVGEEAQPPAAGAIRLQEFPVEALYLNRLNFIAPNPLTPVSRNLNFKPDIEADKVGLPLRILVVVATPTDKPKAEMQEEKNVIKKALKKLTTTGGVELEFCEPPTRSELEARLKKGFHVLHFIGHGAFAIVGDDPTPRPHICLEDDAHQSDILEAETLEIMLQNSGVRLVVMTACASAQPTPAEVEGLVGPFSGLGQRLVAGVSGVSAVVAMQFDLESWAATTFSRAFYTQLLVSGNKLDEVIAASRRALVTEMNVGHRAWITPVLLWRCIDGKVFDIDPLKDNLDPEIKQKWIVIDTFESVYKDNINKIVNSTVLGPNEQQLLAPTVAEWQAKIDQFEKDKGDLLGNALRLQGGHVKASEEIVCRLTLRVRTPMVINNVTVNVIFPADKLTLSTTSAGAATTGLVALSGQVAADTIKFSMANVSQGAQWEPDEYEVGLLKFQVNAGVTTPILELGLDQAQVQNGVGLLPFRTQSAVLFVSKK